MGILNTTPDSFSDGGNCFQGSHLDIDLVSRRVEQMVSEGADIIDVGGESTRPGAVPVGVEQELERVAPVVEAIKSRFDIAISVDTSTPQVMVAAAAAGAVIINDVRALQRDGAMQAAAGTDLSVCLMHMSGEPDVMQQKPQYGDVVDEVQRFLLQRVEACEQAGIGRERIVIDPGFGFGKTLEHNLALFRALPELAGRGLPVLVGVSRKSMIGAILAQNGSARAVEERVIGSVAMAVMAASRGAAILRVHDVQETVDALSVWSAVAEKDSVRDS